MDKYLSIITNFGCHYTCPYCIVKNNNINIPCTTFDSLDSRFVDTLIKNDINIVSVSGGGDPLHNYGNHVAYYKQLFDILGIMGIPLEMHTSYTNTMFPAERCKRIVYHLHDFKQLFYVPKYGNEIVRVVFVVTEDFTEEKVNQIAEYVKESKIIDELSFRQMVDNHYQTTHYLEDFLKAGHRKDWWYIEQNDYNLYYVEGKTYTEYSKIGA